MTQGSSVQASVHSGFIILDLVGAVPLYEAGVT
jgi:hypothetical protein